MLMAMLNVCPTTNTIANRMAPGMVGPPSEPMMLNTEAVSYTHLPFNRLFGFTCPGCGLSRAWISFLRGDWRLAFKSHLLFLPAPVVVFLFAHRDTLFRRCQKTMDCIFIFFAVLLAAYHLLRG